MSDVELDDSQVEVPHEEKVDAGLLIEVIQQYEFVFNIVHPNYKQTKKKDRAWEEIAQILNCSVKAAQKTWKCLRDRFTKEKNKARSGAEAPETTRPYFNAMMFYGKYTKRRKTFSNTTNMSQTTSTENRPSSSHSVWSSDEIIFSPPPHQTEEAEGEVQGTSGRSAFPKPTPLFLREGFEGSHEKKRKRGASREPDQVLHLVENISTHLETVLTKSEPKRNNANQSFADYVAMRLEEMDPEVAKTKRQQLFAVLEE